MDHLRTSFDNVRNVQIKTTDTGIFEHPVIRKYRHAWLHLSAGEEHILYLSNHRLHQLHRRFGRPAPHRLTTLLDHAGHDDVKTETLERINKFCRQCQIHGQAPRSFKFSLRDDHEFNAGVFVDGLKFGGGNVLHFVDAGTGLNVARFLLSMSAEEIFRAQSLDPPDVPTPDAGTNFASSEFRSEAKLMGITCKEVSIEAHQSISKVERAHHLIRRAFNVISADLPTVASDSIRQMAVKAGVEQIGSYNL